MTKKGKQCRGGAMPGTPFCGPHQDNQKALPVVETKSKFVYVLTAQFPGRCVHCGEWFEVGTSIGSNKLIEQTYGKKTWLHEACAKGVCR